MTSLIVGQLRIGDWCVDPARGQISRSGEVVRLEARSMRLLLRLAREPGEVVSIDDLLDHVWAGVIVTPDSVYQAVASLRRLLGDHSRQPRYIATVPRLGYRLVAKVGAWGEPSDAPERPSAPRSPPRAANRRVIFYLAIVGMVALSLFAAVLIEVRATPRSVAVLPFRDMSAAMDQEILADDLTEDLIDTLGRTAGVRTSPPRSSFALKGRKLTAAEAARTLGVDFVVDGSVRRSGPTVQIVVRLVRGSDGLVVRSETYQRPADDLSLALDSVAKMVVQATAARRTWLVPKRRARGDVGSTSGLAAR